VVRMVSPPPQGSFPPPPVPEAVDGGLRAISTENAPPGKARRFWRHHREEGRPNGRMARAESRLQSQIVSG
jgi:hypothetical protein